MPHVTRPASAKRARLQRERQRGRCSRLGPGADRTSHRVDPTIAKRYFRFEVRGLQSFPPGAALVVSNHSGGLFTLDVTAFASEFYAEFGYDRPVYTLSHDMLLNRVTGSFLTRIGFIRADRDCAAAALGAGGVVMVFPGGDYDVYRPTLTANTIDFDGRTGYVRTALEAGVPIVPAVSIGGQETQFFLSRGMWLANRLRLGRLVRSKVLPISIGVPFGLSLVLPINMPLPAKIVTQVLAPIDIAAQFGVEADVDEVDAHVRSVMQKGLDELAAQRRFPVLG